MPEYDRNNIGEFSLEDHIERIRSQRQLGLQQVEKRNTFESFSTFGIEIENDDCCSGISLPDGFCFKHDASIQTPIKTPVIQNVKIYGDNEILEKIGNNSYSSTIGSAIFGVEVASNYPLRLIPEDINKIKKVIDQIYLNGGAIYTDRSGLHIHVSVPISLEFILTSLKYFLHLEDIFFYLGGMGGKFRGINNSSCYCRPITKYGPPVIRKNRKEYCQIFNVFDLLESKSIKEFKYKYGNIYNYGTIRYHPVRYTWINYLPIFTQGSLEYRIFNTTLNTQAIKSVIAFILKLTRYIMIKTLEGNSEDLEIHSIYDYPTKEDIIERFISIAELIKLEDNYIKYLLFMINKTPRIYLINKLCYSHLMFHAQGDKTLEEGYFNGSNNLGNYFPAVIKDRKNIEIPEFRDVHNLT